MWLLFVQQFINWAASSPGDRKEVRQTIQGERFFIDQSKKEERHRRRLLMDQSRTAFFFILCEGRSKSQVKC